MPVGEAGDDTSQARHPWCPLAHRAHHTSWSLAGAGITSLGEDECSGGAGPGHAGGGAMVLVSGGGGDGSGAAAGGRVGGAAAAAQAMDKAWGVTVAPPNQHKRHDPWHKHELADKERAKQMRK
ncbi:hypothetical protein Pmani_005379 [Petrolisthes manimaculis]|uniref:Uncharacterized protein n=1 Tax=Petrolisthes manimaculis TaxID=1843537 RepID=A0AAE1QCK4_9EUCA|nr:hypothetical protein Pmani_005379 [Petrolisthes manimaculis]